MDSVERPETLIVGKPWDLKPPVFTPCSPSAWSATSPVSGLKPFSSSPVVREEPNVVVAEGRVGRIHVVVVHNGLRRCIDAVRRNHLVRERRACRRILDGGKLAEVAGSFECGRH